MQVHETVKYTIGAIGVHYVKKLTTVATLAATKVTALKQNKIKII